MFVAIPHARVLRRWLQSGGLIAYPTESCYGLGCDPTHVGAIRRILAIKRRPAHKGLIVIADRPERLAGLIDARVLTDTTPFDAFWPGPNTLLLPVGPKAFPVLRGRHQQLAVRIPGHEGAQRLCRLAGMPLVSTSANRAGCRSLKTAADCQRLFGHEVWVLGGRIGRRRQPSAIIDFATGRRLR